MQEKQDQKVVLVSLSIHINLKHEEHKSLTQNFFFFFFTFSSSLKFSQNFTIFKEVGLGVGFVIEAPHRGKMVLLKGG